MVGENSAGEMEVELISDETAVVSSAKEDEGVVTTVTTTELQMEPKVDSETDADIVEFEDAQSDIVEEMLLHTSASTTIEIIDENPNNTVKDADGSSIDVDALDSCGLPRSNSVATTVNVNVDEEEDDIIILEDEEDDEPSDAKRGRNDFPEEIMEVDEHGIISGEERSAVGKILRKMSRQDLEDLVLAKIVEAVVAHSEVGHLRTKVVQLQFQKDKLSNKLAVMMKQMGELSSAVNTVVENHARNPENRGTKQPAIKFNRSVGIQSQVEPSVRSAPPKIIRVPEPSQNGVKQYGASTAKTTVYANANNTFPAPQGQPLKRIYQPNKMADPVKTLANNNAITITPRKTYSAASVPSRTLPIAPKGANLTTITPVPVTTAVSPNFQVGGVVDLTDDDPVPPTVNQNTLVVSPVGGSTTTLIGGVQYQLLNRIGTTPATATAAGVQFVTPASQGQGYIVSQTQTNIRGANQYSKGQQIVRGVNNAISQQTVIQRPSLPRALVSSNGAAGSGPRVAVTIPGGVRPSSPNSGPRRFILPALPGTPVNNRIKNDTFKSPPKPELSLTEHADGIVLSWNLPNSPSMAEVITYQIFACQEPLSGIVNRPSQWKKVGDVKALPLPMACTLSQFTDENRYYFIVRGVDAYNRVGPFCDPQNILLKAKKNK